MRRRNRPPLRWVATSQGYGTAFQLTAAVPALMLELVGCANAPTADPVSIERITTYAIKGDILLDTNNPTGSPVIVGMGIIMSTSTAASNALRYNPLNNADGYAPWLWLRHWELAGTPSAAQPGIGWSNISSMGYGASMVDIKVKRVLKPGQALYLMVNAVGITNPQICSATPFLRTLIGKAT